MAGARAARTGTQGASNSGSRGAVSAGANEDGTKYTVLYSTVETVRARSPANHSTVLLRIICVAYSVFFVSRWWESRIGSRVAAYMVAAPFWSASIGSSGEACGASRRGRGEGRGMPAVGRVSS